MSDIIYEGFLFEGNKYSPYFSKTKNENGDYERKEIWPCALADAINIIDQYHETGSYKTFYTKDKELYNMLHHIYSNFDSYITKDGYIDLKEKVGLKMEELLSFGALKSDEESCFDEDGCYMCTSDILEIFMYFMVSYVGENEDDFEYICKFYDDIDTSLLINHVTLYLTEEYSDKYKKDCFLYQITSNRPKDFLYAFLSLEKNVQEENNTKTYLLTDNTGLYKIGRSEDPYKRLSQLSCGSTSAKIYCVINSNIETELHRKFKAKRVKGEWFNLNESDLDYIRKYIPKQND